MTNGRTHLACKADHAVDLETGTIVGVTVQDADDGDTTTSCPNGRELLYRTDDQRLMVATYRVENRTFIVEERSECRPSRSRTRECSPT